MVARFADPPLSTIPQPGRQVGYQAMQLLDQLLSGKRRPRKPVELLTPPVVVRESTGGKTIPHDDLAQARELLHERACEGIRVGDLAKLTDVSKVTFTKRFREAFGRTPGEEIRHVRAERAKYYLANTDLTITRIAAVCGFIDLNKFRIFFKREVDCTPSKYRRQHRP